VTAGKEIDRFRDCVVYDMTWKTAHEMSVAVTLADEYNSSKVVEK